MTSLVICGVIILFINAYYSVHLLLDEHHKAFKNTLGVKHRYLDPILETLRVFTEAKKGSEEKTSAERSFDDLDKYFNGKILYNDSNYGDNDYPEPKSDAWVKRLLGLGIGVIALGLILPYSPQLFCMGYFVK